MFFLRFPQQLENHPKNRMSGQRKSGETGERSLLGDGKEEMEGLMAMQDLVAIDRVSSVPFVADAVLFRFLRTL